MENFDLRIIISCHFLVYGAPQALRDYLIQKRVENLRYITSPLWVGEGDQGILVEDYERGIKRDLTKKKTLKIDLAKYFQDIIYGFIFSFRKSDIYIGVDPLNGLIGVLLKIFCRTNYFIYYTIDYVPKRFESKFLNSLYHYFDKLALKIADETWNVSPRISQGRNTCNSLNPKIYDRQYVVPIGVWFDDARILNFEKIKEQSLIFVGNLHPKQGVQLVLRSIEEIVKKIPNFHFYIVGGGDYQEELMGLASTLQIDEYVTFTGWIKDRATLEEYIQDKALAIAMYDSRLDDFTYYADPTKLKDYLSFGIPILLTDLPHNAYEIEKEGCGAVINFDEASISKAVIEFLQDSSKIRSYRNNSVNYIRRFDWRTIFESAFGRYFNAKL